MRVGACGCVCACVYVYNLRCVALQVVQTMSAALELEIPYAVKESFFTVVRALILLTCFYLLLFSFSFCCSLFLSFYILRGHLLSL